MVRPNAPAQTPATARAILKNDAILWLLCQNCDREAKTDLAAIVARGLGDRPVQELKFRCSACRLTRAHLHLSSAAADRFRLR